MDEGARSGSVITRYPGGPPRSSERHTGTVAPGGRERIMSTSARLTHRAMTCPAFAGSAAGNWPLPCERMIVPIPARFCRDEVRQSVKRDPELEALRAALGPPSAIAVRA
jgi:hypothetical protein